VPEDYKRNLKIEDVDAPTPLFPKRIAPARRRDIHGDPKEIHKDSLAQKCFIHADRR